MARAATTFGAATAQVEITPGALGFPDYYRAGYGSDGPVHITGGSPLYATGVLMVNSAGQRWVAISIDVLGIPTASVNRIEAAAQSQYGIPPGQLLLAGTHTHSGPVLVDQPNIFITYNIVPGSAEDQRVHAYTTAFETRVIGLIGTLVSTPTVTVTAAFATGVANASINRSSARPAITELSVPTLTLRATGEAKIVAVLFSYATHATSAGQIGTWGGDYPAVAERTIESQLSGANPGVRALFLRGASGDLNPIATFNPTTLGNLIAAQAVAAATASPGTGSAPVSEPELGAEQDITAPLDIRVSDAALRAHYAAVAANPPSVFDGNHAQTMIDQIDHGTLRRAMTIQVSAWRFGAPAGQRPLALIGIAGEALADYSVGFEHLLGAGYRTWFLTQTNGHPGYLPPDEVLARGDGCPAPASACFYRDYEAGWATVDAGQRYPVSSGITFNDGLPAPLQPGADTLLCQRATTLLTGSAANCADFTPGRVIPHAALATTGPTLAAWTDATGRAHLEALVLGADGCLRHRAWTGGAAETTEGTWSGWDAPICGSITGPASAEAWTDAGNRAHIEIVVRTGDGSLFHGRCTGDTTGCLGKPWSWTQIGTPGQGFLDQPELAVWQQQNGFLRIEAYAVQGGGRCLDHRGFVGTDTQGNGSWSGGWTQEPGCGGIVGPAGAASWRSGGQVNHDVVVRTTSGALFAARCAGTETSCGWGAWQGVAGPSGITPSDAPTLTVAAPRSDLYVRGGTCVYQAGWTGATIPASPTWRALTGCGLASRVGATDWRDGIGRARSAVLGIDQGGNGPLWIRQTVSPPGTFAGDVLGDWEDIADPAAAISNP
jgi:neutral ceramidase